VKKRQTTEWDDLDPELLKELEKDAGLGVGAIGKKIWAEPAAAGIWRVITPGTTVKKLVWKPINDEQRRDLIVWTVAQVERAVLDEVDPQREAKLSEAMSSNEFAKSNKRLTKRIGVLRYSITFSASFRPMKRSTLRNLCACSLVTESYNKRLNEN
jgi:hypothetical protein